MRRMIGVFVFLSAVSTFAADSVTFHRDVEPILSVPRYDFNWQLEYDVAQPIKIPKGTRIKITAHFDNSANNKFNPDPNQTVYYGDMTWEEMMFPFFSITIDPSVTSKRVIRIVRGKEGDGA